MPTPKSSPDTADVDGAPSSAAPTVDPTADAAATPDLPAPSWWRRPPRYVPDLVLPPYRYVPLGAHPHPTMDPGGHMRKKSAEPDEIPSSLAWMTNRYWLSGVDLYHQFFFWEASETWEPLWRRLDKSSSAAQMIQALIMASGSMLKIQCRETEGVLAFAKGADKHLRAVMATDDVMWGLNVRKTHASFARFFQPLFARGELPKLDRSVPKLLLPM